MKRFLLLFSLLLTALTASAANISANTVIYFDANAYTNIQTSIASGKTLQMLLGHSSWSQGYKMTAVDGYDNIYSVKMPQWDGCTQLAFCTVDSEWGGEGSSVTSRLNWTYEKTAVHSISSNMSGNVGFAGNPLTRTDNYTLPVSYYITGIVGYNKIAMTYDKNKNEYVLMNQAVKSTDVIKVLKEAGTKTTEYKTLEDGSCATADANGIKVKGDGNFDFYFKLGNNKLYVGANASNPAEYRIVGIGGDWTWENGLSFVAHSDPNNTTEVMYQCLELQKQEEIKIVIGDICGNLEWKNTVRAGSVVSQPSGDGNIVLPKGVYDLYFHKTDKGVFIGNPVITACYLIGIEGDDKIEMPYDNVNKQYTLSNIKVKRTDVVKVLAETACGETIYQTLADGSCGTTPDDVDGIKLNGGYYDFYFKPASNELYIGATPNKEENKTRYVLMGVNNDWENGIELTPNPNTDGEYMLEGQVINSKTDAVQIVTKDVCVADAFCNTVKSSSTVSYYIKDNNVVFENGTYNFYYKPSEGKFHVEGDVDKAVTVYLDINGKGWTNNDARISLYFYKSADATNRWVTAKSCDGNNKVFYAEIPQGYDKYIWVRMSSGSDNVWTSKLAQTGNIDLNSKKTLTKLTSAGTSSTDASSTQLEYTGYCKEEYPVQLELVSEPEKAENANSWNVDAKVVDDADLIITEVGFFINKAAAEGGAFVSDDLCVGKIVAEPSAWPVVDGGEFKAKISQNLLPGYWYGYRAYAKVGEEYSLSPTTKWFYVENPCTEGYNYTKDENGYVIVNIDLKATADPCNFVFNSFEQAWAILKSVTDVCEVTPAATGDLTGDKIKLLQPVVMLVAEYPEGYSDNEEAGATGGDANEAKVIFFRNINIAGGEHLLVRSKSTEGLKATLKHVIVRRSKNITFDYLNITGTNTELKTADNAIDIDNGAGADNRENLEPKDWNCAAIGDDTREANIVIKNCNITSSGFTCIHVSAYDGVTFENNEIKAQYNFEDAVAVPHNSGKTQADNTSLWGASAKFINSSNIKFVRNNFVGQHATSILLQGTQKVLIHNNVFWHDNAVATKANTVSIIRLISYVSGTNCSAVDFPLQNIGIYYNTMFLKNNTVGEGYYHYFDFFRLGGAEQKTNGLEGNFKPSTIEFAYNNCYSYDEDVYGKNNVAGDSYYLGSMAETDWCASFVNNNFWSAWDVSNDNPNPTPDAGPSVFELGSGCGNNEYVNVKSEVCSTTPEEPGSLVIKGTNLNIGGKVESDATGGLLTDEMQTIDRLGNTRGERKTLGAYQQIIGEPVKTIIWNGTSSTNPSNWDNRNNWYKEDGSLVTCVDELSEDLKVIIPAPHSEIYKVPEGGVVTYPVIPNVKSDEDFKQRATTYSGEHVNAGSTDKATQIAKTIFVEYGGSIQGVENMGAKRYGEAQMEFVARRNEWLLVGPVVNPWDKDDEGNTLETTRVMVSGDYFVPNQLPHVYMHEAYITSENKVDWDESFAPLGVPLYESTVFAIRIPNQYGPKKHTASRYNRDNNTKFNPKDPITYNYVGRFINEDAMPEYEGLEVSKPKLLTNTYPANINAMALAEGAKGTVQIYDYTDKGYREAKEGDLILSQHGFVFTPNTNESLVIKNEYIVNSETGHRSAKVEIPYCNIKLSNIAASTASEIVVRYDELKEDNADYSVDAPKIYSRTNTVPDLYAIRYEKNWASVTVPTIEDAIPLGVRVSASNQAFTFSLLESNMEEDVILEDRATGKTYNLSQGAKYTVSDLVPGDSEGRFYLNLRAAEVPEEETPGDDVTTEIEDIKDTGGIDIFTQESSIIVSSSEDVKLQTVVISDIAGRTQVYNVSGRYIQIDLPVSAGIYTVNVIGDKQTRVEKIKLN